MSTASEIRAWALATAGVFCLSAVGYKALTLQLPTLPDLAPTLAGVNTALGVINRPCGGGSPCGTLANVNKLIVKVGDLTVDAHRQVVQSAELVNAASNSLTSTSQTVNAQLVRVGPLLDSARGVTDALPVAIASAQADVHGVTAEATGAVGDVRAFIAQPVLSGTLSNVQTVTGNAAAISEDARKVSDKLTADYLRPVPWYLWPLKRSGQIWDIGAAVARHTP